jgi:hypothetical protein
MYRRIFTAVVDTHWSVVLQFDLHHGLEDAVFYAIRDIGFTHLVIKVIIDLSRWFWFGRIVEIRLVAFLHLGIEGELRNWTRH